MSETDAQDMEAQGRESHMLLHADPPGIQDASQVGQNDNKLQEGNTIATAITR